MLKTEGRIKKSTVTDAVNFAIDAYAMESDAEAISADEASNSVVAAMERSNTAVLTLLGSSRSSF